MASCVICRSDIIKGRADLGHNTCLKCGETVARKVKHTIVPMHKSNYVPIFDLQDLKGINNKGGFHRWKLYQKQTKNF